MKSTNGCFVTAINGQHFIVMLNLLQNLGIYNSIHYPTQSNSIFFCPMRKNKGKIYCKTYLQFIKYPVKFSITPKAMNQFHILQWKVEEISVFIILVNILALATLSAHLILTSLLCSLIIPIVITHIDAKLPLQR